MLSARELQEKKLELMKEIKKVEMKVLAYADSCRDSNDEPEYKHAVQMLGNVQAIALN